MRTTALWGLTVWLCASPLARADIPVLPRADTPTHRVHVIDRESIEGRTLVGLTEGIVGGGDRSVRYLILDDFPQERFQRLCALSSSDVVDSPVGGLGPRMLRGTAAASGAEITGAVEVARVLALFDAEGVPCTTFAALPPDAAYATRHIEAVEDTVRVTGIEGGALHTELVSVSFLVAGRPPLVAAALPGGGRPSIPPLPQAGCGCGVGRADTTTPGVLALVWLAAVCKRPRRRRP